MLIKSIKTQYKIIVEKKSFYFMFMAVFGYMLFNFIGNVFEYAGRDVVDMYHPMRILLLAEGGRNYHYFILLYPIIVAIPAAFSYMYDQDVNEQIYIQTKTGIRDYYVGKLLATFIATFMVFTIPFLVEIVLNIIAFPNDATGILSYLSVYDSVELESINSLLLPKLYAYSTYLYAVVLTIVFGIVSGVCASFALAVSMVIKLKYKVFVLLSVYVIIYVLNNIQYILPQIDKTTNYYFYFDMFNTQSKSLIGYLLTVLAMGGVSILLVACKSRKDSI
jgi:hypothetical protein